MDLESDLLIPENLIELSFDGSDWKKFSDGEFPLVKPGIESGDCSTFYVRNKRPKKDIKDLHTRYRADLFCAWEVTQ